MSISPNKNSKSYKKDQNLAEDLFVGISPQSHNELNNKLNHNDIETKENIQLNDKNDEELSEEVEIPEDIIKISNMYNNYEITNDIFTKYRFYKKFLSDSN